MTEATESRKRKHTRLWLALVLVVAILVAAFVPPMVNISHYKRQITQLMATAMGRPVKLSSVEGRLLPTPSFVMTDVTVEEDPAFGSEPILHANTVRASIRLLSLWQGKLVIDRVHVDEASVNLVHNANGRWNLDAIFEPAQKAASGSYNSVLPYIEATNSRVNVKDGVEKLPFSLINTDLSFWEESNGDWRLRLRGQPARTDVNLNMEDTGLLRLEARLRPAAERRLMPLQMDASWRDAQLGQLARLLTGSDTGWRGAMTGDAHIDGTMETALVQARLRAENVHRDEYSHPEYMDFDANCSFAYHTPDQSMEKLICDSPVGKGRIHIAGELPGEGRQRKISAELNQVPTQVALDMLRTARGNIAQGVEAKGVISGKVNYDDVAVVAPVPAAKVPRGGKSIPVPVAPNPLTGSITVEGLQLSGGVLSSPIVVPKMVLEPSDAKLPNQTHVPILMATVPIDLSQNKSGDHAGTNNNLLTTVKLALSGYQVAMHGHAPLDRAKELIYLTGASDAKDLNGLSGDGADINITSTGRWLPEGSDLETQQIIADSAQDDVVHFGENYTDGNVAFHNARWKVDYLKDAIEIPEAIVSVIVTKHGGKLSWNIAKFSYGTIKGSAKGEWPDCISPTKCLSLSSVRFESLDAAELQAALSRPAGQKAAWPRFGGGIEVDALTLGPIKFGPMSGDFAIDGDTVTLDKIAGHLFGGTVEFSGTLKTGDKPTYSLKGKLANMAPAQVGQFAGLKITGKSFDGEGQIETAGSTADDLAASAKGALKFTLSKGSVTGAAGQVPAALKQYESWTGDAVIGNGFFTVPQSQPQRLSKACVDKVGASVPLSVPVKVQFTTAECAK